LDKPNTDKETHGGTIGDNARYGLSSMQGWRIHMEDAHTHVTEIPELKGTSFFAIFDGHGGKTVSQAGAASIVQTILNTSALKGASTKTDAKVLQEALQTGLIELDDKIKSEHEELQQGHDRSGSTVVTLFMTPTHFIIGNVGDSRAVLVSDNKVRFATEDHKPSGAAELERIKKAGGFVEMGRVCGNLAVSRALGDYEYKDRPDLGPEDQKISANADMKVLPRMDKDNFFVMACDGIWDVMSNEQIRVFVDFYHRRGYSSSAIAEAVLDHCLDAGSRDNMSALVIVLPGAPQVEKQLPADETEEQRISRVEEEKKALRAELSKIQADGSQAAVSAPPTGNDEDED